MISENFHKAYRLDMDYILERLFRVYEFEAKQNWMLLRDSSALRY